MSWKPASTEHTNIKFKTSIALRLREYLSCSRNLLSTFKNLRRFVQELQCISDSREEGAPRLDDDDDGRRVDQVQGGAQEKA